MTTLQLLSKYKGIIIRYIGMIGSFSILFSFVDISQFRDIITQLSWQIMLVTISLASVRIWLLMERWRILIPKQERLSRWLYLQIMFASGSVNLFLPGILGSDVMRSIMVAKQHHQDISSNSFISVYFDRIIGLASILIMGLLGAILSTEFLYRSSIIIFSLVTLILIWFILWISQHRKVYIVIYQWLKQKKLLKSYIPQKILQIIKKLQSYNPSLKQIIIALLLCFPIHLLWFVMVWMVSLSIGEHISLVVISLVTIIIWVVSLLPLSIAGIGIRELGFAYLLTQYGVSHTHSVFLGIFQSAILVFFALLGLPLLWHYLWKRHYKAKI